MSSPFRLCSPGESWLMEMCSPALRRRPRGALQVFWAFLSSLSFLSQSLSLLFSLFLGSLLLSDSAQWTRPPWPPSCISKLQLRETTGLPPRSPSCPWSGSITGLPALVFYLSGINAFVVWCPSLENCCFMYFVQAFVSGEGIDKLIPCYSILARRKVNEWA